MSFAFNFSDDEQDETIVETQTSSSLVVKEDELIKACGEFDPIKNDLFQKSSTISAVTEYTDVIPGVYEGGLKIWECSDDLLYYLSNSIPNEDFIGQRVVDLGCGHGHPGIWSLTRGASVVCFQDLNVDALSTVTVPNVLRVCGAKPVVKTEQYPATASRTESTSSTDDAPSNESTQESDPSTAPLKEGEAGQDSQDEITLAKLESLVNVNQSIGFDLNAKSKDLVQYEKIKAMVLAGEESDPEMLEFLIEIEEEMALESAQPPTTSTTTSVGDGKQPKEKQMAQTVQNFGYLLGDSGASLTPHGTFMFGPWGKYALDKYMLEGNKHHLATVSKSASLLQPESGPRLPFADVDMDILPTNQQFQPNFTIFDQQSPQSNTLLNALQQSFQHFSNPSTMNTPFPCVVSFSAGPNDSLDDINAESIQGQYVLHSAEPLPTPTPEVDFHHLIDAFNDMLISASDSTPTTDRNVAFTPPLPTQPNTISLFLSITPTQLEIVKANTSHPKLYTPILQFVRVLCETWNALWSTKLSQALQSPSSLPTTLPTIPTSFKPSKQHQQYCYTKSTGVSSSQFPFITTLVASNQSSQHYHQFLSCGFIETSWNSPSESDRCQTPSSDDQAPTPSRLPQYSHVPVTFAQLFSYSLPTAEPSLPPHHSQYQAHIQSLLSTVNPSSPASTTPSALAYTSQLWYGSHPISSPFRFDVILSSDTIYSSPTMPIFLQTIRSLLSRSGKALIAAKRYYFGVGGSTAEFALHITQNCPDLQVQTVQVFMDGSSNIREILEITWNQDVVKGLW